MLGGGEWGALGPKKNYVYDTPINIVETRSENRHNSTPKCEIGPERTEETSSVNRWISSRTQSLTRAETKQWVCGKFL